MVTAHSPDFHRTLLVQRVHVPSQDFAFLSLAAGRRNLKCIQTAQAELVMHTRKCEAETKTRNTKRLCTVIFEVIFIKVCSNFNLHLHLMVDVCTATFMGYIAMLSVIPNIKHYMAGWTVNSFQKR
jgi:hypothetical protein